MSKIIHNIRLLVDGDYKESYRRKQKFAQIMSVNKSIIAGLSK